VLPVEVSLQNLRITGQDYLSTKEYTELMMDKVDEAPESRLKALEEIEKEKVKIAKVYNKCVMEKSFQVGDLVWKTILPLETRSGKLVNGRLAKKRRLELSGLCLVMLTSWRTLKDIHYKKL
jgi:hypothetical protein